VKEEVVLTPSEESKSSTTETAQGVNSAQDELVDEKEKEQLGECGSDDDLEIAKIAYLEYSFLDMRCQDNSLEKISIFNNMKNGRDNSIAIDTDERGYRTEGGDIGRDRERKPSEGIGSAARGGGERNGEYGGGGGGVGGLEGTGGQPLSVPVIPHRDLYCIHAHLIDIGKRSLHFVTSLYYRNL
jgi:hypothetical protein